MIELTDEEIKGKILDKLVRWKKFMANYTDKRDAVKGMPPHLIGRGLKLIEDMVKGGLLLEHKAGKCVSINLDRKEEVQKLRELFLLKKYASRFRK
jgi:hypothetical protein